jgi:hypothetical protein
MNKPTYEELLNQRDYFKNGMAELQDIIDKMQDEAPAGCLAQVVLPQNAEDAAAMAIIGINWLQEHAPERFTDYFRQVKAEAGRAGFYEGLKYDADQMDDEYIAEVAGDYAERIRQEVE